MFQQRGRIRHLQPIRGQDSQCVCVCVCVCVSALVFQMTGRSAGTIYPSTPRPPSLLPPSFLSYLSSLRHVTSFPPLFLVFLLRSSFSSLHPQPSFSLPSFLPSRLPPAGCGCNLQEKRFVVLVPECRANSRTITDQINHRKQDQ